MPSDALIKFMVGVPINVYIETRSSWREVATTPNLIFKNELKGGN